LAVTFSLDFANLEFFCAKFGFGSFYFVIATASKQLIAMTWFFFLRCLKLDLKNSRSRHAISQQIHADCGSDSVTL